MKPLIPLRQALTDPGILGEALSGPTWSNWRTLLCAAMGEPLTPDELAVFCQLTGRQTAPTERAEELWCVIGRRGGKSRAIAALSVWLALLCRYARVPGELLTVVCIAGSRRQARAVFGYVRAIIQRNRDFARQITRETADTLEFKNGTSIEVYPASHRVRGLTAIACICDEIATWNHADDSTLPDTEIISSVLLPAMATTQGPLIAISSPHARRGALWETFRDHYGREGDAVLVARAETQQMNPRISARWLARQFEKDPAAAAAEYAAYFRTDVETLFLAEALRECTDDVRERAPQPGIVYTAFCDPSGGAGDAMTLGVSHCEGQQVILDCLAEVEGRLIPAAVVARFAEVLQRYQVWTVYGDDYSKEWVITEFRKHGIEYRRPTRAGSEVKMNKSELFLEMLPMVNSRQCVLLRNERLERQLCLLERSVTGASGREVVDHPRGSHDDLANACAGALIMARQRGVAVPVHRLQAYADDSGYRGLEPYSDPRPAGQSSGGYFNSPTWNDGDFGQQTYAIN